MVLVLSGGPTKLRTNSRAVFGVAALSDCFKWWHGILSLWVRWHTRSRDWMVK
jgi:hypothetical protein